MRSKEFRHLKQSRFRSNDFGFCGEILPKFNFKNSKRNFLLKISLFKKKKKLGLLLLLLLFNINFKYWIILPHLDTVFFSFRATFFSSFLQFGHFLTNMLQTSAKSPLGRLPMMLHQKNCKEKNTDQNILPIPPYHLNFN
jgi:hypothetical protein